LKVLEKPTNENEDKSTLGSQEKENEDSQSQNSENNDFSKSLPPQEAIYSKKTQESKNVEENKEFKEENNVSNNQKNGIIIDQSNTIKVTNVDANEKNTMLNGINVPPNLGGGSMHIEDEASENSQPKSKIRKIYLDNDEIYFKMAHCSKFLFKKILNL